MESKEGLEAKARAILSRWDKAKPEQPFPDFAEKIGLQQILERPVFVAHLETLYDVRVGPEDVLVPWSEAIDQDAVSKDIWGFQAPLKQDFIYQEGELVFPRSLEPLACGVCEGSGGAPCKGCFGTGSMTCGECTAKGHKSCAQCGGLGRIACRQCGGRGMVPNSISSSGQSYESRCQACAGSGGPPCGQCSGGVIDCQVCGNKRFVPCPHCGNTGRVACVQCRGQRQLLRGHRYHVTYQPGYERGIYPPIDIPPGLLPEDPPRAVLGQLVYQDEGSRVLKTKDDFPCPEIRTAVDELLKRAVTSQEKLGAQARIVKQKLFIDRIPLYSVIYDFSGKKFSAWISPVGDRVVSDRDPFTELAGAWAGEAHKALAQEDYDKAEASAKKAQGISQPSWAEDFMQHIAALKRKDMRAMAVSTGLAASLFLGGVLGLFHRDSPHLFWPWMAFMILSAAAAAWLIKPSWMESFSRSFGRKAAMALGAAPALALAAGFFALNPIRSLDQREFEARLKDRFGPRLSDALAPEDMGYLRAVIETYQPRGVEVSKARMVLESNDRRVELERLEAQTREEMRRKKEQEERKRLLLAESTFKRTPPKKGNGKKVSPKKRRFSGSGGAFGP